MEIAQMFEQASRRKVRFPSTKGPLTVEDLWDLPLTTASPTRISLDGIAIYLHQQTKSAADTVSFVAPASDAGNEELQLKFEIVKHIIQIRVRERDEAQAAADRRERKRRLLELIARKQEEELGQKSIDELRQMVEAL